MTARATGACSIARDHLDELAGLDVRADLDDELGVPVEPRFVRQSGSCHMSLRRIGIGSPVLRDPVDLELGPADHEVRVDGRDVHPLAGIAVEHLGDAEAVGDVARRVLVVERVEERRVRPSRRATCRRRARARRSSAARSSICELAADDARRPCRPATSTIFPSFTVSWSPSMMSPCERERAARADRALGAAAVGRREHLLRRHVRDVLDPDRACGTAPTSSGRSA